MNILKITREQFQVLEESVRMLFKKLGQAANLLTDARLTALIGGLAIAWISSPTAAGLLAYLVALATQGYFK